MHESLLSKFQNYIKHNELVELDDKILLTVSGGLDSMVMLSLFVQSGYDVGVAHCNFCLRGKESDEDEVVVEQQATKHGVPFYNKRFDTQSEIDRTGESVQMVARRLRYDWFEELSVEHGYTAISIAHHADDSIETFFINLFRGTGLKGLTGITVSRGRIVRPMLFASRKEIADYAHAHKLPFREDSSNRSTKYLRNRIRLGLVPRIREISPSFTETMTKNTRRITQSQQFIDATIEMIRTRVESVSGGVVVIDPRLINGGFSCDFVIYELLSRYGFKGDVVDALCRALDNNTSGRRFYSPLNVAYIDRGNILIEPIPSQDSCEVILEENVHKVYCGNKVIYVDRLNIDDIDTLSLPENIAMLDASKLTFPLTLRRWAEGDRMIPLGMEGHKKVSDMLIDAKVSLSAKARQFVLCNGDDVVWLIGMRIDDRYKVVSQTEHVLRLVSEVL